MPLIDAPGYGGRRSGPERRKARRVPSGDPVSIDTVDAAVRETFQGRIVNVSRDGLGVQLEQEIPSGSHVLVRLKNTSLLCEVRHSEKRAGVFVTGLWIEREFRHSK